MAKLFSYNEQALAKMKSGLEKLTRAVKTTLGPKGRSVAIKTPTKTISTKEGMTVAKEIQLEDPFENMAVNLFKEACLVTNEKTGDGTTTALILAEAIFLEGIKLLTAGFDPTEIHRQLTRATDLVIQAIKASAIKATGDKVKQIATIAANQDEAIGSIIAQAIEKVGKDGSITIQDGKGFETKVEIIEGMSFEQGYSSHYFVTNKEKMTVEFDNPYLLITDMKISNVKDIAPLLKEAIETKRLPLILIADDFDQEILSMLVLNKMKASLPICAVKAPGFGEEKKAILQDIAILTGAKLISQDLGNELKRTKVQDLGSAKHIKITKDLAIISNGKGNKKEIEKRRQDLRLMLNQTKNEMEIEKIQKRLAKLASGIATIYVGGATELHMKEQSNLIEDALNATKMALIGGIQVGGGVAFIRAIDALKTIKDAPLAVQILEKALKKPAIELANNAGKNGEYIAEKIAENKGFIGFDVLSEEFVDLFEKGIIDPALVLTEALKNASSIAGTCLTADALIVNKVEKQKSTEHAHQMSPAGMHGMDDFM